MPTSTRQQKAHEKEFDKLKKQADKLDDRAARAMLEILRRTRRDIASRLISAEGFELAFLSQLERSINSIFAEFSRFAIEDLSTRTISAFDVGIDLVNNPLAKIGADAQLLVLPGIDQNLILNQLERGSKFITNLSFQAADQINAQILLSLQSQASLTDTMAAIGRSIEKGIFKTIANRAETIARTEINTAINQATLSRFEQAAREIPGMKKFWIHPGDLTNPHARGSHIAIWRRTAPSQGGKPIPVRQRFLVGGERALAPHGAGLSAKNVINCRCRLGSSIVQAEIQQPLELGLFL